MAISLVYITVRFSAYKQYLLNRSQCLEVAFTTRNDVSLSYVYQEYFKIPEDIDSLIKALKGDPQPLKCLKAIKMYPQTINGQKYLVFYLGNRQAKDDKIYTVKDYGIFQYMFTERSSMQIELYKYPIKTKAYYFKGIHPIKDGKRFTQFDYEILDEMDAIYVYQGGQTEWK